MRIVIISAGVLPIPAVKGGAVENLINSFIVENESVNKNNLIIYSIDDPNAREEARKFKYSDFRFINNKSFFYHLMRIIRYSIKKIFKINISNQFITSVIRDIKKVEFDIIIVENKPDFVVPLKNTTGRKVILHLHNDYLSKDTKKNRSILNQADKVVTVSNYIEKQLKWYNQSNKIITLYNGIDTLNFKKSDNILEIKKSRRQLGLSENDYIIMYSGRITKNKGIDKLIEAVTKIEDSNVKLLVVGSSWYSDFKETPFITELKEKASVLNERIIFTGYIEYSEMPKVYSLADVLVVPSIGTEAAGLVAIEARASGLPLIISNSGGLPEYVNEKCAIVVNRDEQFSSNLEISLRRVICNENLRKSMSENSLVGITFYDKYQYYLRFMDIINNTYKNN